MNRRLFPAFLVVSRFCVVSLVLPAPQQTAVAQTNLYEIHAFGVPSQMAIYPQAPVVRGTDGRLYGVASSGGPAGAGAVFGVDPDGTDFTVLHTFSRTDGLTPRVAVTEGSDTRLYGVTSQGGSSGQGVLFRVGRDGTGYEVLHTFLSSEGDGWMPEGRVLEATDGWLYGTTQCGGAEDVGTIYKVRKDGSDYSVLHALRYTRQESGSPMAGLVESSDGLLYGTSTGGGKTGRGTVFRLAKDGSGYQVLAHFGDALGAILVGEVTEDPDHWLYGTTVYGGDFDQGTVYRVHRDGGVPEILHSFDPLKEEGTLPMTRLVLVGTTLFGTTSQGGVNNKGTAFRIEADGSGFQVLRHFTGVRDDGDQASAFCVGAEGTLFGTTQYGGVAAYGTVFGLDPDGTDYRVVHSFLLAGGDGQSPRSTPLLGSDQALYGTTIDGGSFGRGSIFKVGRDGTGYAVLHSFAVSDLEGTQPFGSLVESADGRLYGTTYLGGAGRAGTLYRLHKDGTGFEVVHSLTGATDGQHTYAGLARGTDGMLYGVTLAGGPGGKGTIFRLNPNTSDFSMMHSLATSGVEGAQPLGGLLDGDDGYLYGTTSSGGASGQGVLFRIQADGTGCEVMYHFSGTGGDGSGPAAKLVDCGSNTLCGTTRYGGSYGAGMVFRIQKNGTGYTVLHHFRLGNTNGADPNSELALGPDGTLYGTTYDGGSARCGVVYRLNQDGTGFQLLHSFTETGISGNRPRAGLCVAPGGWLYGTSDIGRLGNGVLFLLSPYQPSIGAGAVVETDGSFTVGFRATPSTEYEIQGSENLVHWVGLGTATADESGNLSFTDSGTERPSFRFYRTRLPLP